MAVDREWRDTGRFTITICGTNALRLVVVVFHGQVDITRRSCTLWRELFQAHGIFAIVFEDRRRRDRFLDCGDLDARLSEALR